MISNLTMHLAMQVLTAQVAVMVLALIAWVIVESWRTRISNKQFAYLDFSDSADLALRMWKGEESCYSVSTQHRTRELLSGAR